MGKIYVFVSSLRYRKTATYPVKISLAGVANGTAVTAYVVDNAHSNQYDAGSGNGPRFPSRQPRARVYRSPCNHGWWRYSSSADLRTALGARHTS